MRGLLNSPKDFITAVDEKNIIVVKELGENDGYTEMDHVASEILNLLRAEGEDNVHIAYGTIINDIKEVSKSYKEAKLALDVGKIFFDEKDIIAYNTLGIGRLIYQLPIPLCKMFIREIFDGKSPDDFDDETLTTINKFFENNLNVRNIKTAVHPQEYLLYTGWTNYKRVPVLISVFLKMRLHSKLRSW